MLRVLALPSLAHVLRDALALTVALALPRWQASTSSAESWRHLRSSWSTKRSHEKALAGHGPAPRLLPHIDFPALSSIVGSHGNARHGTARPSAPAASPTQPPALTHTTLHYTTQWLHAWPHCLVRLPVDCSSSSSSSECIAWRDADFGPSLRGAPAIKPSLEACSECLIASRLLTTVLSDKHVHRETHLHIYDGRETPGGFAAAQRV